MHLLHLLVVFDLLTDLLEGLQAGWRSDLLVEFVHCGLGQQVETYEFDEFGGGAFGVGGEFFKNEKETVAWMA